jgi:hypothetical protein
MKVLGWYTFVFNAVIVLLLVLASAGVIGPPPFTWFETLLWGIFTAPVLIMAWTIARSNK